MNNVTIVLPISRTSYLQTIFSHLETLTCDRARTSLLTIVDGDAQLYAQVRNFTEMSKFGQRLCVQFSSKHTLRSYDILGRRMRISDIHNFAKHHIKSGEFVLGLEDDTLVPNNTLHKLMADYAAEPFAGFIQGVELGRWGIPYIGAWMCDDIYEPSKIESMVDDNGLKELDAGGFYCFLTRAETYVNHEFKPFDNNSLGPDVDFGLSLRRAGMQNFVDFSLRCIHMSKDKTIGFSNTTPTTVTFIKRDNRWRQSRI